MNHKIARITKDHKAATALVVLAAVAAVMIAGTIAVGSGNVAFAGKANDGISVPTPTKQHQECETAGGTSPITGACIATSTNTITQSGGVLSEEK